MQPFLQKLANYIKQHYSESVSELCIVLPNRRAKLFLKNYLSTSFNQPIWTPQIFSIEDFISEVAGAQSMDALTTAFEFYSVYSTMEGEKAQSVDDFLQWAPTLLHDFNEMDQYLVDANALFSYLSEERAIALWNVEKKELTEFQKKYLLFWKSLAGYYQKFTSHLESKNLMYQGMAYRKVASDVVNLVSDKKWKRIIFAGFNALNTAEKSIFKSLAEAGKADILWDADNYYLNDENQEAGKFLRVFKETFGKYNAEKSFLWHSDELSESPKHIVIAGVAQQVGQAKVAGELLRNIGEATQNNFKNHALVLADENLLMPVLHSIPDSVERFNVTMGYSLKNLALNNLIDILFSLQENAVKYGKGAATERIRFYYRDLKKLFLHPYLQLLFTTNDKIDKDKKWLPRNFIHYLEKQNIVFVSFQQIKKYFEEEKLDDAFLMPFLQPWENEVNKALHSFLDLIETLRLAGQKLEQKISSFELEVFFQYSKITKRILSLLEETSIDSFKEIKTIRSVFNQLVNAQSIAFIGEPLEGLQIMGMLETRSLDFETVILLSTNEGVLPAAKKENSFIPFELKNTFGLPTYSDKDAIFGYHFYRLLQCAKNIYLIYNTETDEFGSGEKSRYITQLQHELQRKNKQVTIEERLYTIPLTSNSFSPKIHVQKNDFVKNRLKALFESGLSPSALNVYRMCSLRFYFNYVARLYENEEPDESIDAATFGTVMHAVLEESYMPFIGKVIHAAALRESFGVIEEKVEEAFRKIFKYGDLHNGKNYLNLKVAEKYLSNFVNVECNFIEALEKQGRSLTLLKLENELSTPIQVNQFQIKLKGKVDRIDRCGAQTRIIDYKTGEVKKAELTLKNWEDLRNPKYNKAFQLLLYAYLYQNNSEQLTADLSSGIISFRNLNAGLMPFNYGSEELLTTSMLKEFEQELKFLLAEIINPELQFEQTEDEKHCEKCPYLQICNR